MKSELAKHHNNLAQQQRYVRMTDEQLKRRVEMESDRRRRMKDAVIQSYGGKCACCGIPERAFLQLHHVNGNGAAHRKDLGYRCIYMWAKQNFYPPSLQVLCANCHVAKERGEDPCPCVLYRRSI
jgi:hypothetical protein